MRRRKARGWPRPAYALWSCAVTTSSKDCPWPRPPECPVIHPAFVALHWLLALLIISALGFGFFGLAPMPNSDPQKVDILRAPMIIGILIPVPMVLRLVVRLATARPPEASTRHGALDRLQPVSHRGFYLLVLLMVGSGLGTSFAAGLPAIVFGHSGTPLPDDFDRFRPFLAHSTVELILAALVTIHCGRVPSPSWR